MKVITKRRETTTHYTKDEVIADIHDGKPHDLSAQLAKRPWLENNLESGH